MLAALLLPILLVAGPVGAAEAPPDLTVTIVGSTDQVVPGGTIDYTVTVLNNGTEPFDGIVSLEVPPYVTVQGDASWGIALESGNRVQTPVTVTVGDDVGTDTEVVVKAGVAASAAPDVLLVRAGTATAIEGAVAAAPPARPLWPFAIAGAVLVLGAIAILAFVLLRRRAALLEPSDAD